MQLTPLLKTFLTAQLMMTEKKLTNDFNKDVSRSYLDPKFTKQHLAISRGEYDQVFKSRNKYAYGRLKGYGISERHFPTVEQFLEQVKKVGKKYGWDKRTDYLPENHEKIRSLLSKNDTRMFIFTKDEDEVGFCLTSAIDPEYQSQGRPKAEIINQFKSSRRLPSKDEAIEINKIGLYDEFTRQGHGNVYLAQMMHILFEKTGYDIVYLDTRDTNHKGVLSFYAKNGISVFFEEILDSDISSELITQQPNIIQDNQPSGTDQE